MWKQLEVRLNSVSPLIMHNGQLADPRNPIVKEVKKISGKRKKTDADYDEMARLEFQGSLYMGENGPVLPAHVLEGAIINGAKKNKEGTLAKPAIFIEKNFALEYDGPKDRDGLWNDETFRTVDKVSVNRASVMRTRPLFREWAVTIIVNFDDTLVNKEQVEKWIANTGQQVGVGDWRPRHGRFTVEWVRNGQS